MGRAQDRGCWRWRRRTWRSRALSLRTPGGDDVGKLRPLPLLGLLLGRANIDETGHALVVGKPKRVAYAGTIAVPLGDPLRAVAERGGGDDQILAGGAGRKDLLPVRRSRVFDHARDH